MADGGNRGGKNEVRQTGAAIEGFGENGGHALRNRKAGQAGAIRERTVADERHAVRDRERSQIRAAAECTRFDGRNAVRQVDGYKAAAGCKRIFSDGRNAVRQRNSGQVSTIVECAVPNRRNGASADRLRHRELRAVVGAAGTVDDSQRAVGARAGSKLEVVLLRFVFRFGQRFDRGDSEAEIASLLVLCVQLKVERGARQEHAASRELIAGVGDLLAVRVRNDQHIVAVRTEARQFRKGHLQAVRAAVVLVRPLFVGSRGVGVRGFQNRRLLPADQAVIHRPVIGIASLYRVDFLQLRALIKGRIVNVRHAFGKRHAGQVLAIGESLVLDARHRVRNDAARQIAVFHKRPHADLHNGIAPERIRDGKLRVLNGICISHDLYAKNLAGVLIDRVARNPVAIAENVEGVAGRVFVALLIRKV